MAFVEDRQKLVQLTYSFIFKRSDNLWNSLYEFEHDIAEFLRHKGLQAQPITFIEGSSGNRTLYVTPMPDYTLKNDKMVPQQLPKPEKPSSMYGNAKKLTDKVLEDYNREIKKQKKSSSISRVLTAKLERGLR